MLQQSNKQALEPHKMLPQIKIMQMINGYRISQAIFVAAKLGIADLLKDN